MEHISNLSNFSCVPTQQNGSGSPSLTSQILMKRLTNDFFFFLHRIINFNFKTKAFNSPQNVISDTFIYTVRESVRIFSHFHSSERKLIPVK